MYKGKVDVDLLNAVKSMLANILLIVLANILFTEFSISTSTLH